MSKLPAQVPLASFEDVLKPVPTQEVRSKMARTDEEVLAIKNQAAQLGFEEGRAAGYLEGRELGRREGFAEGFRQAQEEIRREKQSEIDDLRDSCQTLLAQMHRAMQEWFISGEGELAQLSAVIAARILARELSVQPESIVAITKEALAEVTHATHARIRANPFDAAPLREHREALLTASQSVRDLEIVEDAGIIGGCVIETEGGIVEATIEMKMNEILSSIRRAG